MAAYFIDLDGTVFKWQTNEPLEGAKDRLMEIHKAGHQIIFTTKRGRSDRKEADILSQQSTIKAIEALEVPYDGILFGITSPRIVVNDRGCGMIQRQKDEPWTGDPLACLEGLETGA